jgi:hypothetical protein
MNMYPASQAAAAVEAATRDQAMRGYQADIAAGKTPAEALAKWAPMLYTGPKGGNLGQAAGFIRATREVTPRPMNVGGQAWIYDQATRSMQPLTPSPRGKADPFEMETYRSTLRDIQATQKDLDANPAALDADDKRRKLQYLRSQAAEIAARNRAPAAAPTAATGTGGTVVRRTKDGRRAVFDAQTKRFLRYAE